MSTIVELRAVELAKYITFHKSTVRQTARYYGVSKSTVHTDVTKRLKQIDPQLYREVRNVLETNKQQRHIRGGLATQKKYSFKNIG